VQLAVLLCNQPAQVVRQLRLQHVATNFKHLAAAAARGFRGISKSSRRSGCSTSPPNTWQQQQRRQRQQQ
jgi:hypothetical protein